MLIGYGADTAPKGGLMGWWSAQDTTVKIILGVSAAAILGGGLFAILGKKPAATAKANKRRSRRFRANMRIREAFALRKGDKVKFKDLYGDWKTGRVVDHQFNGKEVEVDVNVPKMGVIQLVPHTALKKA